MIDLKTVSINVSPLIRAGSNETPTKNCMEFKKTVPLYCILTNNIFFENRGFICSY